MINQLDIDYILQSERACFEELLDSTRVSNDCTAFALPVSDQHPYYDLVFPESISCKYYREEIDSSIQFYSKHAKRGHIMVSEPELQDISVARGVCLYLPEYKTTTYKRSADNLVIEPCFSTEAFYNIVGVAFDYEKSVSEYFINKLSLPVKSGRCKLWTASNKGVPCGALGMFTTTKHGNYLFQGGVLPEHRGRGVMTDLLRYVLENNSGPFTGITANPVIYNKSFPSLGFSTAGAVNLVPIDSYINDK